MANLKISIIERLKTADDGWTSKPVDIPKQRPNAKGRYMWEGKFLLVWRESGRKRYSAITLRPCLRRCERRRKKNSF